VGSTFNTPQLAAGKFIVVKNIGRIMEDDNLSEQEQISEAAKQQSYCG